MPPGSDPRPRTANEPTVVSGSFPCRGPDGKVCAAFRGFVADLQKWGFLSALTHKLRPWPQPGGSGSGPAYMTLNTAREHVRAARGAPGSPFALALSVRNLGVESLVFGMSPLIEQLLWLCLGKCERGKETESCLLEVLLEGEPHLKVHGIKKCSTVLQTLSDWTCPVPASLMGAGQANADSKMRILIGFHTGARFPPSIKRSLPLSLSLCLHAPRWHLDSASCGRVNV